MITTGRDGLIRPQFCAKMDQWVCKLDMAHIEEASHWVTLEWYGMFCLGFTNTKVKFVKT